jgi:hypothetical protein
MSERKCELCELVRSTRWYAQFYHPLAFTVLDCDSCDTPMAVLGEHRATATEEERRFMVRALEMIGETIGLGDILFDDRMRQIPDHYHLHARVAPAWWPRSRGGS